ncbi:MAG: aminotransferase class III-fold pyridoxal phosphate-dependent enzyme [Actinomycetota bacterium]
MTSVEPAPSISGATEAAVAAAHERYRAARPRSAAQAEAAAAVLPGGSTRSVLDFAPFPFRVARADGAHLHDVDGHTYLDLLGDYTAGLLGHNPPEVAAAVVAVTERGWSLGAVAEDEHRLAELITSRFASMAQMRFTNSGTEANLMAISLARHTTGRTKVLVFDGAYHGGLLYFGAGGEALRMPFDYVHATYNDSRSVAEVFERHGAEIACVLVEPMMGAGGGIQGTPAFLAALRQTCRDHGALLVFDEVMTSRMSIGGAQGWLGITPDITTLGKYLGGGMTFGAFGASAELMAAFDPARGGTLTHGGTFNNNAITMRAGVAAVEQILTADALDGLFARGERLRAGLTDVIGTRPYTVTGWGSILGVHATGGPVSSPADLAGVDPLRAELLFHHLLDRGIYIARRGFIALSLPVTDADLDRAVEAVDHAITTIER